MTKAEILKAMRRVNAMHGRLIKKEIWPLCGKWAQHRKATDAVNDRIVKEWSKLYLKAIGR